MLQYIFDRTQKKGKKERGRRGREGDDRWIYHKVTWLKGGVQGNMQG